MHKRLSNLPTLYEFQNISPQIVTGYCLECEFPVYWFETVICRFSNGSQMVLKWFSNGLERVLERFRSLHRRIPDRRCWKGSTPSSSRTNATPSD